MTGVENLRRLPELDDPWRRLPWVTLAAVSLWILLLAGFSLLLERAEPPAQELKPLEARIVEVPPDVGGLAGGGGAPHPAAPAQVKPRVAPAPVAPPVHPKKKVEAPPMPVSPNGTATTSTAPAAPAAGPTGAEGASSGGESGGGAGSGSGSGNGPGGIGSDSIGAHAIYAPVPEIPDDLREDVMQTEAVAHFKVTYDGQVEVTLRERPAIRASTRSCSTRCNNGGSFPRPRTASR